MPKSKTRKGRKPYRARGSGLYAVPDTAELFLRIGQGYMDPESEERAAKVLFSNLGTDARQSPVLREQFGDAWPPADWQALVQIARNAATQLTGSTDGNAQQGGIDFGEPDGVPIVSAIPYRERPRD